VHKYLLLILAFCCFAQLSLGQKKNKGEKELDSLQTDLKGQGIVVDASIEREKSNPLAPSKAAFYSAVLPGLGQVYNKRYWKVPLVYAALGIGISIYNYNDNLYDRYREAFKRRRAGFTDDEFYDINDSGIVPGSPDLSDLALQSAQERFQNDRDLALIITIGLYVLNIVDANVDAHLRQFNVDDNLSLDINPYIDYGPVTTDPNFGLAFTIKF
jgi:hypothetical protein